MTPVVHQDSLRLLKALWNQGPHALLVTGPEGIGLATIVKYIAAQDLGHTLWVLPEKDEKVDIEKGNITVESIRRLYDATKTVSKNGRLIVIDYAERMAPAAQNAFLKLLEEPGRGTRFVLLTHAPDTLLPTIVSRVQQTVLRPVSTEQSSALLDALGVTDPLKRTQLLFIADGLPALLTRLVKDEAGFSDRTEIVKDARTLLTGSDYDRLLLAKKYKDSRAGALVLLSDAMKLLRRTMQAQGDAANLAVLTRLEHIYKRISEQGNVRLQLSATVV